MKRNPQSPLINDPELIFDRYYNLSLRYLSYRPRSEQEVYKYLLEKSKRTKGRLDESTIAKIMQRLIEYKFIDDLAFTRFWIEHRKKGFRFIRIELQQKGVSKDVIDQAASEFDLESKENDLLKSLIFKKSRSLTRYPKEKAKEKMIAFLLRKGFDYDEVKKALKD